MRTKHRCPRPPAPQELRRLGERWTCPECGRTAELRDWCDMVESGFEWRWVR